MLTDNGKQQLIDLLCEHVAAAVAATVRVRTGRTAGCFNGTFELLFVMLVVGLGQQSGR